MKCDVVGYRILSMYGFH